LYSGLFVFCARAFALPCSSFCAHTSIYIYISNKDRKASIVQAENRTGRTGHAKQDRQKRICRTGHAERDSQTRTGRTGKEERKLIIFVIGRTGQADRNRKTGQAKLVR
jgi:hypothetical protein